MKNNKKGNKMFLSAMLGKATLVAALVLVLGMALTGCETESDTGGGSVPDELIAKWYYQEAKTQFAFEFTSGGIKLTDGGITYGISIDDDDIYIEMVPGTETAYIDDYVVSGNTLTGTMNATQQKATFYK